MGLAGRSPGSWGYHGDDSDLFISGTPYNFGTTYGTGDVIGCGVDKETSTTFFTKNRIHLGKGNVVIDSGRLTNLPFSHHHCRSKKKAFPASCYIGTGGEVESQPWKHRICV